MQHCYIQISEWLQWRIQISGLGLESNESGKKKKKKNKNTNEVSNIMSQKLF